MIETQLFDLSIWATLYLWVAFAFVAGFIAKSKKRDPLLYFIVSLVFSPIVAIPLIIGLTDRRQA
jgi:hypothetical protein